MRMARIKCREETLWIVRIAKQTCTSSQYSQTFQGCAAGTYARKMSSRNVGDAIQCIVRLGLLHHRFDSALSHVTRGMRANKELLCRFWAHALGVFGAITAPKATSQVGVSCGVVVF